MHTPGKGPQVTMSTCCFEELPTLLSLGENGWDPLSAQVHSTGLSTHLHTTHQVPEHRRSLSEGLWVPPAGGPQGVLQAEGRGAREQGLQWGCGWQPGGGP